MPGSKEKKKACARIVYLIFKANLIGKMVSSKVYCLSKHPSSVTAELAKDPSQDPEHVFKNLYEHHDLTYLHKGSSEDIPSDEISKFEAKDELQKAYASGRWGSASPSDLFLQVLLSHPF